MAASTTPMPWGVGLKITEMAATAKAATKGAASSKPKAKPMATRVAIFRMAENDA